METPEQETPEENGDEGSSPPEPTHEATTPPGNPEQDEEAVREAQEGLEQAGGGH